MKTECEHCKGDGYLDWVENIVGKEMSDQQKKNEELTKIFKEGNFKITMGSGKYKKTIGN
jgi:hypothetical protein